MSVKKMSRTKKIWLTVLAVFVLIFIAFRIYLPSLVLRFVNNELTKINGYTGHVHDIDIRLLTGSYRIKDIELKKTGGKIPVPFFSADVIDLSVEWRALFNGEVVGEIEFYKPQLNFVKGPTEETSQTHIDKDWRDVIDDLMPLKINRLTIDNGEIHYRDFHSTPKIDLLMQEVNILAENLNNAKHNKELLPSTAKATAFAYGGMTSVNMRLNPLEKEPTFDLNAELRGLDIVKLNDFLKAYGNFDVHKGSISIYAEAAAKENKLTGYAKPIIKDLKVVNWKEDKKDPVKLVWEGIIEGAAWIFKNHPKDQLATQVNFEGNLKKPDIDIMSVIGQTLKNAFIQALYPSIENSISISSPMKKEKKSVLKKIFDSSSKDTKKESKDSKKDDEKKDNKKKAETQKTK
jgi:hypothetical protein